SERGARPAVPPAGPDPLVRLLPPSTLPSTGAAGASVPMEALSRRGEETVFPSSDVHVELDAERSRGDGSTPSGMRVAHSWKRALDLEEAGAGDDGVASSSPFVRWGEDDQGFATLRDGEGDAVAHNRVRLGLFDDRLRLTTGYAQTRYDALQYGPRAPGSR